MTDPEPARRANGVAITGPVGTSVTASGPNAIWIVGFLVMGGAILYATYRYEVAITRQSEYFKLITDRALEQHVEMMHALDAVERACLFDALSTPAEGRRVPRLPARP
jgi:hypothetical protein